MLHEAVVNDVMPKIVSNPAGDSTEIKTNLGNLCKSPKSYALLPTAIVQAKTRWGTLQKCTVLLDSGSQCSFITENCLQKLKLKRWHAKVKISGLATANVNALGRSSVELKSCFDTSKGIIVDVLILRKITSLDAYQQISDQEMNVFKDVQLADTNYFQPKNIDILIGADYFFSILKANQIKTSYGSLVAQETMFGWILSGITNKQNISKDQKGQITNFNINIVDEENIDKLLRQFWEQEELPQYKTLTNEEELCEKHFTKTHTRNKEGRYMVRLPFKEHRLLIGNTYAIAYKRLQAVEQKMKSDTNFKLLYKTFMKEYLDLNHMKKLSEQKLNSIEDDKYYLPHHGVIKADSATTKLRVVFDGSSKSLAGTSLNHNLAVGPTIQPTLWTILLRFRLFPIALCADIEKMYRQVLVAEEDQRFQLILWRDSREKAVEHYALQTVTYGISSAPFLAVRSLFQLAADHQIEYPIASQIVKANFYVDDMLTGANNIQEAIKIKKKITKLLELGGFNLRKWKSNNAIVAESDQFTDIQDETISSKLLGLQWNPESDCFQFTVTAADYPKPTKRQILSFAAKLFDPLGWLAPSTIRIKILLQKLWLNGLDWDDNIPKELVADWNNINEGFKLIEQIRIPRFASSVSEKLEIHGFSDASESAYSAAVYLRSTQENGIIRVHLLAAKTKVSPVKQITLPRLELNGAQLLTKLVNDIQEALNLQNIQTYAWTDSEVVLAWLSSHPTRWKTYIANRTSNILEILPRKVWGYVKSIDNPADCGTRGIAPNKLINNSLWWNGPEWLRNSKEDWPTKKFNVDSIKIEERNVKAIGLQLNNITKTTILQVLLENISSWSKLKRIIARVLRFVSNIKHPGNKQVGFVTTTELQVAEIHIIRHLQFDEFNEEISLLKSGKVLKPTSKLASLAPFVDADGLLRVGGRLQHSDCSYNAKHPIILQKNSIGSLKILTYFHDKYLHPGPSLLVALSRSKFWIMGVRSMARKITRTCVRCYRHTASTTKQLMGSLPKQRVTPSKPFNTIGIDYAGPIMLASKKGRGAKSIKGYIAVFVCFATKALHIEVVSDMSTEAFIAALKRFSARRGVPAEVHTDNGSTFIGAKRLLSELYKLVNSPEFKNEVGHYFACNQIQWHFIPPLSPHFGGIWERAVRSIKTHLIRVIGNTHLTFEEMCTTMAQIEAILNSRPLCAITNENTCSIDALTPAHFLLTGPITSIPEPNYEDINTSRLNRWQHVQKLVQCFWRRYSTEYLNTLQQRNKWKKEEESIKVGDVVLLKDNNLSPCNWPLAVIEELHPGADSLIRVVTIKTATSKFKRPISKICRLPLDR